MRYVRSTPKADVLRTVEKCQKSPSPDFAARNVCVYILRSVHFPAGEGFNHVHDC